MIESMEPILWPVTSVAAAIAATHLIQKRVIEPYYSPETGGNTDQ